MPDSHRMGPTRPGARLKSVDAVRGFALFGVLLVNMYNFGAYSPEWTDSIDRFFQTLMHSVFETKSWRLFSMLFGFGFAMQMAKMLKADGGSAGFYIRRLVILFVIGMGHALFYDGDILMEYALFGLFLIPFRKLRSGILLVLSVILIAAFPVGNMIHTYYGFESQTYEEDSLPLAERRVGHPYLGSVGEMVEENAAVIPPRIWTRLHGPESSLAIFAMFLLGLNIGRSRILEDVARHRVLILRVFSGGMTIGVLFALLEWLLGRYFGYVVFEEGSASIGMQFLGDFLFAYGSTALALGYASAIVLLSQRRSWAPVLRPFENLGRMALTVYLSGTLMFSTLFYGYGFGQLFLLGPAKTTAYAVLFFVIQVVFCSWWLSRFRFGPAEWLWRSLTYWKVQPLRI
ncbi:DUF418 domain-containing protein [Pseudomonadota bacterium]